MLAASPPRGPRPAIAGSAWVSSQSPAGRLCPPQEHRVTASKAPTPSTIRSSCKGRPKSRRTPAATRPSENLEGTVGYKLRFNDAFSLTGRGGIGENFQSASAGGDFPFYVFYLAADLDLTRQGHLERDHVPLSQRLRHGRRLRHAADRERGCSSRSTRTTGSRPSSRGAGRTARPDDTGVVRRLQIRLLTAVSRGRSRPPLP